MKTIILLLLVALGFNSCKSIEPQNNSSSEREEALVDNDTVVIGSDETTYEIIIIEPGFNAWLQSIARPEGYYSQNFLETRNQILVQAWNQRVLQPSVYDPNLYELQIDYNSRTDYGYEVNYKLYNYFIYFQRKYNQRLSGFIPRI
ncbi:DUF6146 family protein [Winogradskyella sp. A3E31]|uniref:DUF6146 family protein n=1 Tax=Winogradskyella sp. A3E31 TaxID=3349637 RepID=UPI00398A728C